MNIEYFYIKNSFNEWSSDITGYYETLEAAKEGLKTKNDWYCDKGTGTIYKRTMMLQPDGSYKVTDTMVYEKRC